MGMKVFVSSLIGGMEELREAAVDAIESLGHTAITAETFSAGTMSPKVACLAGVRDADIVLLMLGSRYGDIQKGSGVSATHEEYRAAKGSKPVLVFVSAESTREDLQKEFVAEVEGWEDGHFRAGFTTSVELKREIIQALHRWELSNAVGPVDIDEMERRAEALIGPDRSNSHLRNRGVPTLLLAVSGGPTQQIIRPSEIEKPALSQSILRQALFGESPLFITQEGSKASFEDGKLLLSQSNGNSILMDESGSMLISSVLTAQGSGLSVIIQEDVVAKIRSQLIFVSWLLDHIDSSERITRVVPFAHIDDSGYTGWRTQSEQQANPNNISYSSNFGQGVASPVSLSPIDRPRASLRFDADRLADDLMTLLRRQRS